jgi:hypothetical protein
MASSKSSYITESEFYMWRAVLAFAFADNLLSLSDQDILSKHMRSLPFSLRQRQILRNDFKTPPNVEQMYKRIIDAEHRKRFCSLARSIAWSDGDMDKQEEIILGRVGCLGKGEGRDFLMQSREDENLYQYHRLYEEAGVSSFFRSKPSVEMHV